MIKFTKTQLKKIILKKEEALAQADDLYKWSFKENWKAKPNLKSLQSWSLQKTKNSKSFYTPKKTKVNLKAKKIFFKSPLKTKYRENLTAYADYHQSLNSKAAVIILGHWNSEKTTYNSLAKLYQKAGISAVRLSLPYHDERRPASMPIASAFLSANLNQTIESVRLATLETRILVEWLKARGYKKIGLIGASLGSSVALLTAAHDKNVSSVVLYLSAADTADLIWRSTATKHLRKSFGNDFKLQDLRKAWSCITPSNYFSQLARPDFSLHLGWGRYDTVCPPDLTQKMLKNLRQLGIDVNEASYPCGHNTLAIAPFIHIAGFNGLKFLRKNLVKPKKI